MVPNIAFITDTHGFTANLKTALETYDRVYHLGDLGFSNSFERAEPYDNKLRLVAGNHDLYSQLYTNQQGPHNPKFYLGSYGSVENIPNSFFVRGARSMDQKLRRPYVNWWPEEELNWLEQFHCFENYRKISKPRNVKSLANVKLSPVDLFLSHAAPNFMAQEVLEQDDDIFRDTSTEHFLKDIWTYNPPKVWIFGHYHKHFDKTLHGTRFICLPPDEIFTWEDIFGESPDFELN